MNENECCIENILEVIDILQQKSEKIDDIPNTCDRPFLGFSLNSSNSFVYNTRPITIYNANNTALSIPYTLPNGEGSGVSSVFRIEKVNNHSVTLRVLAPNPDTGSVLPYVTTNSFCNVNTNCICALQCLPDTFVDCL